MTFFYNNVYLNETSSITGPAEATGPLAKYYDKSYLNLHLDMPTFEQAEVKLLKESIYLLLKKINKNKKNIDVLVSGDLLNQIVATNYAASTIDIPLIGIYAACATSVLGLILVSNMISSKQIKNGIVATSSHNNTSEKQFRQPIEYGGPKKMTQTITVTGAASFFLSSLEKGLKVESATIGKVVNMGIKDQTHVGAIMAPAAADTIYKHLTDTKREVNYYDLILTGDLGIYGKDILKDYMEAEYHITLSNLEDAGSMIYDLTNPIFHAGGSGPACLPLVFNSYIMNKMKKGEIRRILLVATGALFSRTMVNQKLSIPAISHAISLEVLDDIS